LFKLARPWKSPRCHQQRLYPWTCGVRFSSHVFRAKLHVYTPVANRYSLISYVHSGPSGTVVTGRQSIVSMNVALFRLVVSFFVVVFIPTWRSLVSYCYLGVAAI